MLTLSKSKYVLGLQCPKLLWCLFNAPELIPPIDESTQAIFDQGREVGNFAETRRHRIIPISSTFVKMTSKASLDCTNQN
ncbi:hypothetical protein J4211_04985 [Candidatus Woesearchaeota archaeon]|nr:hypothetical protein [Candidatus Woesearchaeota archaeon]